MLRNHPWLTEEAIIFLLNYLQNNVNARILEFGSGASTIWFSKKTKNLFSIEHDIDWYVKVKSCLESTPNCNKVDLRLIPENYYRVADKFPEEFFDLILVDGQQRLKCIKFSKKILKKNGVLMLDNAERSSYRKAYEHLKDWPLQKSIQTSPDIYNSYYTNWQTNWWIKK